jgi:hypothetical protein
MMKELIIHNYLKTYFEKLILTSSIFLSCFSPYAIYPHKKIKEMPAIAIFQPG